MKPSSAPPSAPFAPPETGRPQPGMIAPDRCLAMVRIVVGFWFVKSLWSKFSIGWAGGVLPIPTVHERWKAFMPQRLEEWVQTNPIPMYRTFLEQVAIPNGEAFAHLTALGEVAVGLGLTFGLLTGWAALGGLFLMANYTLASAGVPFNQQGFHLLLIACLAAFLFARAGRTWGMDGWLARRTTRRPPLT